MDDSILKFIEYSLPFLEQFPLRLGYGTSMGGFGVSLYADHFKMDRILIFNPISTLNKEMVPWERRFQPSMNKLDFTPNEYISKDGAATNVKGFIVYDPIFDLDCKHAKRYKNLIHLKLPGVGHGVITQLQNMKVLKNLVEKFLNNSLDSSYFHREARKRRKLPYYYRWLLSKQNEKHLTPKRKLILIKHRKKFIQEMNSKNKVKDI